MFLKTVFLQILLINICGTFGENQTNVEGGLDIKDAIEKFLKDFQSKVPEIITIPDQNLAIPDNKLIKGTFNVTKISITGLKEFNATVIYRKFVPVPKAYILFLENLCLNLDYKSDLIFYNSKYLSLLGEGLASISLKKLIFDGNVSVTVLPVNASITTNIDLDEVLVNITGLLYDDILSHEIGEFLGAAFSKIFATSKRFLSETLTSFLNFGLQAILHHNHTTGNNIQDFLIV